MTTAVEKLACPVCREHAASRAILEQHLIEKHPPQVLAATLIFRTYPPREPCRKRKFPSESAAFAALISAALSRSPNRAEKRTYVCPSCGAWHLTKHDERANSGEQAS